MRFAQIVFRIAGAYGLLVLLPQYFLEQQIGRDSPPPLNHVEYFYGFVGVALAWQLAFLIIGHDPVRYRLLMLPAIVEKASFVVPVSWLYWQGRVPTSLFVAGLLDGLLGVLFAIAFWQTGRSGKAVT